MRKKKNGYVKKHGLTETPTELVLDLDDFILKQKKQAKIVIVEGICLIWLLGFGLALIIFGIWILSRSDESSFIILAKNTASIAKKINKPVRFVNVPPKYFRGVAHLFPSQSPISQSAPQSYPMNTAPSPVYNQPTSNTTETFSATSNFCKTCGNKLEPHQKFCISCGQER
ncbi:hypothetical protein ES708_16988 [subsurface metagenome]